MGFQKRCAGAVSRSEEHTSELQSRSDLVCRLLLEKKKTDQESKRQKRKIQRASRSTHDDGEFSAPQVGNSLATVFIYPRSTNVFVPFFFFNDTATTEIYTLSLHDALPI